MTMLFFAGGIDPTFFRTAKFKQINDPTANLDPPGFLEEFREIIDPRKLKQLLQTASLRPILPYLHVFTTL